MGDTTALSERAEALMQQILAHDPRLSSKTGSIGRTGMPLNSDLPIASLPSEVVCIIFQMCIEHYDISSFFGLRSGRQSDTPKPHAWMVVTQVCQRWRELALNMPVLRTNIYICRHTVRLAKVFVARSKDLKLHFRSLPGCKRDDRPADYDKILSLITENLSRVAILALSRPNRAYSTWMARNHQALQLHAPVLHSIECYADWYDGERDNIPEFFTALVSPLLARLRVQGHAVPEPERLKLFTASLTHLTLEGSQLGDLMNFDPSELVESMRHLQALESVRLIDSLRTYYRFDNTPVVAKTSASFPRLLYVKMRGAAVSTILFLDHLDLPASAQIDIEFSGFDVYPIAPLLIPALHSKLSQAIPGADDSLLPVERITVTDDGFEFLKRLPQSSTLTETRGHPPGLVIRWDTVLRNMSFVNSVLVWLCPELPVSDTTHFTIACDHDHFTISNLLCKVETSIEVLSFDAMGDGAVTRHHVLNVLRALELPRLRHLVLEGLRFSASGNGHGRRFKYAVYDLLKKRDVERGLEALEEITILRCSAVTQKTVDLWEDLVGWVDWDGYGDDLMESDEETSTDSAETDSEDEGETESETED
ncbi:hypothetical protein EIP91_009347 [Steccherinum ochraceum]|uniref:Uncharacterized protein n=1 Tax=Steccherinum ochraceum TaxID=92696 RepID=A0A4V2MX70_9APHY|nr:hypothetical protein EIP91_009347 [Steccherinum ochraceum]